MLIYAADIVSEQLLLTLTSYIWSCWDASSIKNTKKYTLSSLNLFKRLHPDSICPVSVFICSTPARSITQQFQMTSGMEISMANQNQGTVLLALTDKAKIQQTLLECYLQHLVVRIGVLLEVCMQTPNM